MCKRNIVALVSVFMCLVAMAQNRISLFHLYDWNESPTGQVTITASDPYYYGGWTVLLQTVADEGSVVARNGLTLYQVPQPLQVDYRTGTVALDATSDDPFAVTTGSRTAQADGEVIRVDSVLRYYVINEEWLLGGDLMDVQGELQQDGTMHIPGGFAYYIETEKTTTITGRDGESRTFTDESFAVSRVFRDLWLLVPNGKHEFIDVATGEPRMVDVCIRQSGDTVYVTNIYGYGAPEVAMVLNSDGTMTYPQQMLRDIPASAADGGEGLWYNATAAGGGVTGGNTGNASIEEITWGHTVAWNNAHTWPGWEDNRLYYTDGSTFVIPSAVTYELGDVNHDGEVNVSDVTLLIQYVLGGSAQGFYSSEANMNGDGEINVADVTMLINKVLNG